MTRDEIIALFKAEYQADNGLARLDPKSSGIDDNGNGGVRNENGILFLAIFCELTGWIPENIKEILAKLEVEPGLYNRQEGYHWRINSADNYLGHVFFGQAKDIVDYGRWRLWYFHNAKQDVTLWSKKGLLNRIDCIRQPGETAFYKLMAGERPGFVSTLHLAAGILINAMKWGGDSQLCWLRRKMLSKVQVPYIVAWAMAIHKKRFNWNPNTYYKPGHPILEVWNNE